MAQVRHYHWRALNDRCLVSLIAQRATDYATPHVITQVMLSHNFHNGTFLRFFHESLRSQHLVSKCCTHVSVSSKWSMTSPSHSATRSSEMDGENLSISSGVCPVSYPNSLIIGLILSVLHVGNDLLDSTYEFHHEDIHSSCPEKIVSTCLLIILSCIATLMIPAYTHVQIICIDVAQEVETVPVKSQAKSV